MKIKFSFEAAFPKKIFAKYFMPLKEQLRKKKLILQFKENVLKEHGGAHFLKIQELSLRR